MKILNLIAKAAIVLVSVSVTVNAASAATAPVRRGAETNSKCAVSDDSLRHMAAKMLMVGFRGNTITPDNPVVGYLKDLKIKTIILFDIDLTGSGEYGSRNITSAEQLAKLTTDLRKIAGGPLLIAVDQEGGRVQRLKPAYGWERIPSARVAAAGGPDSVRAAGALSARQLSQAGINLNLAPEADLLVHDCPVIAGLDRAYSANPDSVALFDSIVIAEHRHLGVATTLKHFPGHGSATSDSHHGFVDVTNTWSERELIPFKRLIDNSMADAIMTAHIFNRKLDADYPASLSEKITDGLLRKTMGFDGLIITDDLYMEAVRDNYSEADFIIHAVNSGADLLCVGNNISTGFEADRPQRLVDIIVGAVRSGRIPLSRLIEANRRIDKMLSR